MHSIQSQGYSVIRFVLVWDIEWIPRRMFVSTESEFGLLDTG